MDTVKDAADRIEFYLSEENIQQDGVLSAIANQNENKCNLYVFALVQLSPLMRSCHFRIFVVLMYL